MNSREIVKQSIHFNQTPRLAIDNSFWDETLSEWEKQGYPKGVEPWKHFDLDVISIYFDSSLRLPEELLEDTDEYAIRRDKHGFTPLSSGRVETGHFSIWNM